jgi:hypothetical protein
VNRNQEFQLGMQAGVNTLFSPIASGVRKINDGIFTGQRGAYQRYNVSSAASDVVRN